METERRIENSLDLDTLNLKKFRHHHTTIRRWISGAALDYNRRVVTPTPKRKDRLKLS